MPTTPTAGFNTRVYESGAAVPSAAEACVAIADGAGGQKRYQITNAAHRKIDPRVAVTVKENGVAQLVGVLESIGGMNGIITFAVGHVPTAPVTLVYSYVPVTIATLCKAVTVSAKRAMLDKTTQGDAFKNKLAGLKEMSGDLKTLLPSDQIYDGVAAKQILDLVNGTERIIEVDFTGAGTFGACFWGILEAIGDSSSVDGIVEDGLTFSTHSISQPAMVVDGSPYVGLL
jgi:hypothetical protein